MLFICQKRKKLVLTNSRSINMTKKRLENWTASAVYILKDANGKATNYM